MAAYHQKTWSNAGVRYVQASGILLQRFTTGR
jgi:hypothetical protein